MAHIPTETKNQAPSLRERVARAMCRLHARYSPDHERSDEDVEKFIDWHWMSHEIAAEAAIEAVVEAAVAVADDDVRDGMGGRDLARDGPGGEMTENQTPRAIIADAVEDALTAMKEAGLVIVPAEPTAAMIEAGRAQFMCRLEDAFEIWRAMVRAA